MDTRNWLFLLPDGTETIVRVFAPEMPEEALLVDERSSSRDEARSGAWRMGLVLTGRGELDGRLYECLARIEEHSD
jgi:hypothetical protein